MGLGHFGRIALLDRDGGAGRTVRIDRRCRPEHIERDAVMAGQHGDADVPILLAASPSLRYGRSRPARPAPGPRSSRAKPCCRRSASRRSRPSSARRTSAGLLAAEDASHRHRPESRSPAPAPDRGEPARSRTPTSPDVRRCNASESPAPGLEQRQAVLADLPTSGGILSPNRLGLVAQAVPLFRPPVRRRCANRQFLMRSSAADRLTAVGREEAR